MAGNSRRAVRCGALAALGFTGAGYLRARYGKYPPHNRCVFSEIPASCRRAPAGESMPACAPVRRVCQKAQCPPPTACCGKCPDPGCGGDMRPPAIPEDIRGAGCAEEMSEARHNEAPFPRLCGSGAEDEAPCHCGSPDEKCCGPKAPAAASFIVPAAPEPVRVCRGGSLPFAGENVKEGIFRAADTGIELLRDGEYCAVFSLALPPGAACGECVFAALDSMEIFHSRVAVAAPETGISRFTGHCTFTARRGQLFSVTAPDGLYIPPAEAAFPAASLNIIRLG